MEEMNSRTRRARTALPCALFVGLLLVGCGESPDKLVASARQLVDRKDYKAAVIQLKNALKAKPEHPEARYLLGTSLLELGDLAAAEKELRKAAELGYPQDQVFPGLATTLLRQGETKRLLSEFSDVHLKDSAAESKLRTVVGEGFLASGRLDDAAASYGKARAVQPGYAPARVGEAKVLASKRDFAAAQKIVDDVRRSSPKELEALMLSAELARAQNQPEESISDYRSAVDAEPDSVAARYALGVALLEQNRVEDASAAAEGLASLAPRDARTLHLKALVALQEKKYPQALDASLQLLKLAPDLPLAVRVAGLSEFFSGHDQQAQYLLEKVLQRAPGDLYVRRFLVMSLARSGDLIRAKRVLEQGLALSPKDSGLLILSGEVALAQRDVQSGIKAYEQAIAGGLNDPAVSARLGQLYLQAGDTAEGLNILESSSVENDEQGQADSLLAAYYLKQGKVAEALPWIERIEKKRPNDPAAITLRGNAYLVSKDEAAARASFEKALQSRPIYTPALVALARLDLRAKNPAAADKRFQAVLEKEPDNEGVALAYVSFLMAQNSPVQRQKDVLIRLVKSQPRSVRGRAGLIATLIAAGEAQNAVTIAQEGLATNPDNAVLLRALGYAQLTSGNGSQAEATFSKLATIEPESPVPLALLAYAHIKSGDDQRALDALGRALKIAPGYFPAQVAAARLQLKLGNKDAAIRIARDVQRLQPKTGAGYLMEAEILRDAKRWTDADRVLQAGLAHAPSTAVATQRYRVLFESGQKQQATAFANQWLATYPKDVAFRAYLAQGALAAKDYAEASKQYKSALNVAPDDAVVLNNLAWVSGKLKDPKAIEYAEKAYSLAPDSPAVMDTLGELLVEGGQHARGLELLRKALERAPQANDIRLDVAKALIATGDKKGARKELESLAQMGGTSPTKDEAQELLKTL